MTVEYTGRGDPERSMALLWGDETRPKRGPKPGLSVELIVRTAVEVADVDGLNGLSMRAVAERLGFTSMSLYRYVPGKGELIDLMLDAVFAEAYRLDTDVDEPTEEGWRARLEQRAYGERAMYHRHPWMLHVSGARPVLGPNELDVYEAALATVDGIGLGGAEMASVVELVSCYVRGAAQYEVEEALAERHTGQTNDQWWLDRAPLLDRVFDAERYPVAARIGSEWYDSGAADQRFEFGLQRVLDGIEVWVGRRRRRIRARNTSRTSKQVPDRSSARSADGTSRWTSD